VKQVSNTPKRRRKPAQTVEDRENELVKSATDLAAQQLRDGTASPSVITHFLRLGSVREQLERRKLLKENEMMDVKMAAIEASERREQEYAEAINALRRYKGETLE
jgi:hypothetical protein